MSKTKEELEALKKEYEELNEKCKELTMEELEQVTGGVAPAITTTQKVAMDQKAELDYLINS